MNNSANERLFGNNAFEAVVKQAVIDNFDREVEEVFTRETPDITPSKRHERRMRALFARDRRNVRIRRVMTGARRFSAAAAVLVLVLSAALISVPAVRAAVGETFVNWFDKYTKFMGGGPSDAETIWEPAYVPAEFSEVSRTGTIMRTTTYQRADGEILVFLYAAADNSISVNNEGVEYGQVTDRGVVYHTFAAKDDAYTSAVVWDMDGYRFCVGARIAIQDLLEMARSVQKLR